MAQKTSKKMSNAELQSALAHILTDTTTWTDSELSVERAEASDYYLGKPLGNEEEGRSQIVMTEVRDGILGVLPSALRVIFGPERAVEFVPRRADTVALAEQQTDYVQYIFADDNPGFLLTHAVWKDALLKKIGIFKWSWEPDETKTYKLVGVTEEQLLTLQQDGDIEITRVEISDDSSDDAYAGADGEADASDQDAPAPAPPTGPPTGPPTDGAPQPPQPPQPPQLFDVELTKTLKAGRIRLDAVPPEEFLVTRLARTIDDALLVAHRMEKTRGELIEMGVKEADIEAHGSGPDLMLQSNAEEIARREIVATGFQQDPAGTPENDKILYVEAYAKIDFDGDGKRELRRICTIGPGYFPVENDPVSERPFSYFTPDPEPHAFFGQSYADRLKDMQRLKSNLVRSVLDSLAASIFPRTGYVEGMVNVSDILNTAMGAPIRMTTPNAIQPITHTFVGADALPLFQLIDDTIERRTGRNKGVVGLDADALQSTTQSAVSAAMGAAQEQAEMLVRIFAEMCLKPMFRGVYRLIVERQMKSRIVRLRGQYVEVDPRAWDADMDVIVNVALGSGLVEKKIAVLEGIAAKQELVLTTLGPSNPIVSMVQYSNTLSDAAELMGRKDPSRYFTKLPPTWTPPPAPPAPPDPAQIQAQAQIQVEQIRSASQQTIHAHEMELKALQTRLQHERDMAKIASEQTLKRYDINAKHGVALTGQQTDAAVTHTKNILEHQRAVASDAASQDTEAMKLAHDMALAHGTAGANHALAVQQLEHEQQLAQEQQQAALAGPTERSK